MELLQFLPIQQNIAGSSITIFPIFITVASFVAQQGILPDAMIT